MPTSIRNSLNHKASLTVSIVAINYALVVEIATTTVGWPSNLLDNY